MARGLSSCGAQASLLHGMWDLLGPGLEPVSPALAGRFLTTVPPGKSLSCNFFKYIFQIPVPYQMYNYKIFSPILCIVFSLSWTVSFEAQKLLVLMKSNLFIISFVICAFAVVSKNP